MKFFNPELLTGSSLLVYSGTVDHFSEDIEIQKDPNSNDPSTMDSIRTTYRAQFRIQGKQIVAEFLDSVMIKNGDQISVCGTEKNGQLHVLSFKNHTQNISQHSSIWWLNLSLGVLLLGFTFYIYFYVIQSPMFIEQLFVTVFTFAGGYLIYRGLLIQKAIGLMKTS